MNRGVVLTLAVLAVATHGAADEMLYYVEDGSVVFTNVASRPDVRTVPGFEERVAQALRGDLPNTPWDRTIELVALQHGLSPDLVKAVALVESGLDPKAVSPKGAMGLMQLMPATAEQYGVTDPFDPDQNLRAGTEHLAGLLDEFDGDLNLALAAYNAGAGAVRRYGGIPKYRETQNYVRKVRGKLNAGAPPAADEDAPPPPAKEIKVVRRADGSVVYAN